MVRRGAAGMLRRPAPAEVVALADLTSRLLPRFASTPHKDPRAPQNLVPIGGLERELRRRLGDQQLLSRSLRAAGPLPLEHPGRLNAAVVGAAFAE